MENGVDNLMTFIHCGNLPIHQLSRSLLHITNLFFAMVDIIHHMVHCYSIHEQTDGMVYHIRFDPMSIHEIPHFGMGHKNINHKRA
jgi:hypothetical protein